MTQYRFGAFTLDPTQAELRGPDGPVAVEPQVFDVLAHLVARSGELVTKEDLLDEVWGDRFVSESALTSRIRAARAALGDDGKKQWAIATVHGRGYRFVADVEVDGVENPEEDEREVAPARVGWPRPRVLPPELRTDARRPFVGREVEVDAARAFVSEDYDATRVIWILGEPGIGKTRLAAQIAQQADRDGAAVLFGRCNEDLSVPLQPFVEMLRAAAAGLDRDELADWLGPDPAELVRLVPELAAVWPGLAPAASTDADSDRYRLHEAVAGWATAASEHRPHVLVIDDAHWATDSTIQLLAHLLRSTYPARVTLVVTARDTRPDESTRLGEVIAAFGAPDPGLVLHLEGLDRAAVEILLDDKDRVDLVLEETAGNPLLIGAMDGGDASGRSVADAVHRRLSRLDESTRDTLSLAAVSGLEFDLRVLAAAEGRDELDLIDELDRAAGARLVDEVAVDTYRFTHALVRASLRDDFSDTRRARLHRSLADAIESVRADDLSAQAASLAHHYAAAGADSTTRPKIIDYSRRAATHAAELLSFDEADVLYDQALAATLTDDHHTRAELLRAKGEALSRAGLHVPALRALDDAFTEAGAAGDDQQIIATALAYEDVSWRPGEYGGPAVAKLRAAETRAAADDLATQARIQTALTRALYYAGEAETAREAYERARSLAHELGDPEIEARSLAAALSEMLPHPEADHRANVRRLRELADQLGDVDLMVLGRQYEVFDLLQRGDMAAFRRAHDDFSVQAAGIRSRFWDYLVENHRALRAFYDGDLALAEKFTDRCYEIAGTMTGEDTSGTYGLRMFLIRREQDRLAGLRPVLAHLRDGHADAAFWGPGLAILQVELGELDEAEATVAPLADAGFDRLPYDAMWATILAFLAEVAVATGRRDWCASLHRLLAPQSGRMVLTGAGIVCLGTADRYLGMLAHALGRLDEAEARLRSAAEVEARNGSPLWAAHARYRRALVLVEQDRVADAAELAVATRSTAREHGFVNLARRIDELMGSHDP
jgi:DNA-binding winged helix-turn-helix (wHTH) protein